MQANSSIKEDTSTYIKDFDAVSQREQPMVSSAGEVRGTPLLLFGVSYKIIVLLENFCHFAIKLSSVDTK